MQPEREERAERNSPTTDPHAIAALVQALAEIAYRHRFGRPAVQAMWESMRRGHGNMALFDHAEFGGGGQWLRGGMIVVGDLFNEALTLRVGALCDELSQLFDTHPEWRAEAPRPLSVHWWPAGLSAPSSCGAQSNLRYAWFPRQHRLAVERDGRVRLYDTEDHHIGGVLQPQGNLGELRFATLDGSIDLASLREVPTDGDAA
jgi:hypothetical protein